MLEVRELPELIASLPADHVEKSVRLLADDDFATQMRSLIASFRSSYLLIKR